MKKMNWKRRMISAALALSMVASFLPAGLIPEAEALLFEKNGANKPTLEIDGGGGFTATFHTQNDISASTRLGTHFFALIPDVGLNGYGTVSEAMAEYDPEKIQTVDSFQTFLKQNCGFDFSGGDLAGCLFTDNLPADAIGGTDSRTVTITETTISGWEKLNASKINEAFGSIGGDSGIPYIAVLFSQAGNADVATAPGLFAGSGLDEYEYTIVYDTEGAWDVDDGTGSVDRSDWRDVAGETGYIEINLQNLGAEEIEISTIDIDGSSDTSLSDYLDADICTLTSKIIPGNLSTKLTVEFESGYGTLTDGVTGTLVLLVTYYVGQETDPRETTITIHLSTTQSGWDQERVKITKTVQERYVPASSKGQAVVSWHGTGTLGTLTATVPSGRLANSKISYYRTADGSTKGAPITSGESIGDGEKIIVEFEPVGGLTVSSGSSETFTGNVNITANSNKRVTVDLELIVQKVTADSTVVVKKNGGVWNFDDSGLAITLQKLRSDGSPDGAAIGGSAPGTGNVFTANGTLEGDYEVLVNGTGTGVKLEGVEFGKPASVTLHYYDVQLAAKTTGGSATATYNGTSVSQTTSVTDVATILVNAAAHTVTTTATDAPNHIHGWTAEAGGSAVGSWTDPAKASSSWTVPATAEPTWTGAIILDPNFTASGKVSVEILVRHNYTPVEGASILMAGTAGVTVPKTNASGISGPVHEVTKGSYTISVTAPAGLSRTFRGSASVNVNGNMTGDNKIILDFYDVTLGTATGAAASPSMSCDGSGDLSSGYLTVLSGTTVTFKAKADTAGGYTGSAKWTFKKKEAGDTAFSADGTDSGDTVTRNITKVTQATPAYSQGDLNADPKDVSFTYGVDTLKADAEDAGSVSQDGYTGTYTMVAGTLTGVPGGLTVELTTAGKIIVYGRPYDIYAGANNNVTFTARTAAGSTVDVSFKVAVGKYNPHITVTDNLNQHYQGEPTKPAANVTFSGPYYDRSTSTWVDLTQATTGVDWSFPVKPYLVDAPTTSAQATVTYTGTATTGNDALTYGWTTDQGTGNIAVQEMHDLTVTVQLNGKPNALRDGATVTVTGFTDKKGVAQTYTGTIAAASHSATIRVPKVGTGSYTVTLTQKDASDNVILTDVLSLARNVGSLTYNYYDVNYKTLTAGTSGDHGKYGASLTNAPGRVLVNPVAANNTASTTKNSVTLPTLTPDTNYAYNSWGQTPASPAAGAFTISNTTTGAGTWKINDGYGTDLTAADPDGVMLTPPSGGTPMRSRSLSPWTAAPPLTGPWCR